MEFPSFRDVPASAGEPLPGFHSTGDAPAPASPPLPKLVAPDAELTRSIHEELPWTREQALKALALYRIHAQEVARALLVLEKCDRIWQDITEQAVRSGRAAECPPNAPSHGPEGYRLWHQGMVRLPNPDSVAPWWGDRYPTGLYPHPSPRAIE